jgi:hypothetical protein
MLPYFTLITLIVNIVPSPLPGFAVSAQSNGQPTQ